MVTFFCPHGGYCREVQLYLLHNSLYRSIFCMEQGGLRLKVQPLVLLYTKFLREKLTLSYPLLTNGTFVTC